MYPPKTIIYCPCCQAGKLIDEKKLLGLPYESTCEKCGVTYGKCKLLSHPWYYGKECCMACREGKYVTTASDNKLLQHSLQCPYCSGVHGHNICDGPTIVMIKCKNCLAVIINPKFA